MTLNFKMTDNQFRYSLWLFYLIVFIVVVNSPISHFNDSDGYLNMDLNRSAGYPVFLWILRNIFGSLTDIATVIIQVLIGISCMYFFITRLEQIVKLQKLWYLLLAVIIASPYFYSITIANAYLSEALTYPLYLVVVVLFLESLLTKNIRKLWFSLPILMVLIITRSQFLFMVPVAILMLCWLYFEQKNIKKHLWIGIAFLILPFVTSLVDKTYHQLTHGYFVNTPWTGIHLITPAFYVADESDYQLYDSKDEQLFFKWIYAKLYSKNLNVNNLNDDGKFDETGFYINHFTEIANATIYDSGKNLVGKDLNEDQKYITLDQLTKKMALPLVLDNFGLWTKLYLKNFINAFANAKYALIYVLLLIFGLVGLFKKRMDTYKVITLLILLTFGNVALVSIGMHTIKRFIFYNDWVLFFVIFILMNAYLKHKTPTV